jgi:hypothetical protein
MKEQPPGALLKNPYAETTEDTVSLLFCSKCSEHPRAYDGSEMGECLHSPVRRVVWRRPVDRSLVGRRFGTREHTGRILSLVEPELYCVQRREIPPANTVNVQTFSQFMAASEIVLVPASEVRHYTILPD